MFHHVATRRSADAKNDKKITLLLKSNRMKHTLVTLFACFDGGTH